jgi:hypothetical protein
MKNKQKCERYPYAPPPTLLPAILPKTFTEKSPQKYDTL